MSDNNNSSGGIGFFGTLGIAFIILKLCKVIDWSWWWVTSPLWGPLALAIAAFLIWLPFKIAKVMRLKKKRNKQWEKIMSAGKPEFIDSAPSKWSQRMERMQEEQVQRMKQRERKLHCVHGWKLQVDGYIRCIYCGEQKQ